MKRVLSIVTNIIAALLFVGGMVISIIDLVSPDDNVLSVYLKDRSYNFLLLVFCAVGLVIILDNVIDGSLRKDVNSILKLVNREKIDVKIFPTQVEFYDYFEERIKNLSSTSSIYVTTFDKYNADYDHTEGKEQDSDTFMECWDKYVVRKGVSVKQLVHITDKHDVDQLKKRIENNKKSNNFIISAMVGLPSAPNIDWIVIDERYTLIAIPTHVSNPYEGEFGFAIDNEELAKAFIKYYDIYSSKLSQVVLSKNGTVNLNHLDEVTRGVMQTCPDLEEMYKINKSIIHTLSDKKISKCIDELTSKLYEISVCDKTGTILDSAVKTIYACTIRNDLNISIDDSLFALLKIYESENVTIKAVSCADILPSFWSDDIGKTIQRLCKDSSKHNHIERVYIYNGDEKVIDKIIKEQKNVVSHKIDKSKFPIGTDEAEDFIIVNDKMLLILKNESALLTLDNETIKKYSEKFKSLAGYSK